MQEMSWAGPWILVRLEWLCFKFSYVTDAHSGRRIQCVVRAYLLYLVGCTLLSDKNGTRVYVEYLQLFEDLGQVSSYAWGAATLAYLYRQLGYASRGRVKQVARYLSLLEVLLKTSHGIAWSSISIFSIYFF